MYMVNGITKLLCFLMVDTFTYGRLYLALILLPVRETNFSRPILKQVPVRVLQTLCGCKHLCILEVTISGNAMHPD